MRPIPMLACSSVPASSTWYQRVLGFDSAHGGDEYAMPTSDGAVALHDLDADEHPHLLRSGQPLGGNGVAAWLDADTTDLDQIRGADAVEDDHVNPLARSGCATPTATSWS